jgi:hypothetical protein
MKSRTRRFESISAMLLCAMLVLYVTAYIVNQDHYLVTYGPAEAPTKYHIVLGFRAFRGHNLAVFSPLIWLDVQLRPYSWYREQRYSDILHLPAD